MVATAAMLSRPTKYDSCLCGAPKRTAAKMCRPCRAEVSRTPLEERFWARVDRRSDDECWSWTGADNGKYGILFVRKVNGAPTWVYAHRLSWELVHGPIPAGTHVDHLCSRKLCVNPRHLEPVSPGENQLRRYRRAGGRGPEPITGRLVR